MYVASIRKLKSIYNVRPMPAILQDLAFALDTRNPNT